MRTLRFLLRKEFLQIFRDRMLLAQVLLSPLMQLVLLGSAATFEVRHVPTAIVDEDFSQASRGLEDHLAASGRFTILRSITAMPQADDAMLHDRADLILRIPSGFERDLVRTGSAPLQMIMDAENGAAAVMAQSYATHILASYSDELTTELHPALDAAEAPDAVPASIQVETRGWYNPAQNYKYYIIPGILVQLVTVIGTLTTAMNIAREKEIGTLDQLNVTPVLRSQLIAAKVIPTWLIALAELTVGLVVAHLLFRVPVHGSIPLVFSVAAIYLFAALGIGLFISTLVDTQQQAMFVSYFVMMIYLFMSGLFTPVRSMPTWTQWLAQLNPVKHFIVIMRAVLLKGAGFADIRTPFLVLVVYAAVVFSLAVRQYSKTTA